MLGGFTPKVSIVLLNYNGAEDTIECLKSLDNISYRNCSIVIVDNASTDDSMGRIEDYLLSLNAGHTIFSSSNEAMESDELQSKLTLLQTGHNGGYGYGNNIGLKFALKYGGDYFLILNNDTVVEPGFLEPMVARCEEDKSIGIASGKIYYYEQSNIIWFNGGKYHPYTAEIVHANILENDVGQKPPEIITFISGCLWLIPKNVISEVGLINEEYFMYVEDLEFTQRVLRAGYKLAVLEQSHIWHKVGSSTGGRFSEFSIYWRTKNMFKFIRKENRNVFILISVILFFNIKQIIKLIREKKINLIFVQIKAILHAVWLK